MWREEALVGAVECYCKKTKLYVRHAGRIHKEWCKERINLRDQLFKKKKPNSRQMRS